MKRFCPVCKLGTLSPGTASARFERDGMTVVIEEAPALVCDAAEFARLETGLIAPQWSPDECPYSPAEVMDDGFLPG